MYPDCHVLMRYLLAIFFCMTVIILPAQGARADNTGSEYGDVLAGLKFRVPEDVEMRKYLGIEGIKGTFTIA